VEGRQNHMDRRNAYQVFLVLEAALAVAGAIYGTVTAIYRIDVAGLNPLQLVLVGTALEGAYFLANVPTGVVADVYSRRLSVVIGTALIGMGYILEGSLPLFATILLAQVIWGTGASFVDGAKEAWIACEIGDERAGRAFLRASQVGSAGGILGALVSVLIGGVALGLPMIVAGVLNLALAGLAALAMPEAGFVPVPREERSGSLAEMTAGLRRGSAAVRHSPLLLTILSIALFAGMASEGFDRLWAAHLLQDVHLPPLGHFKPVVWFGVISVVAQLLSIAVTEAVRRFVRTDTHATAARALFAINGLLVLGVITFGLAGSLPLALGAYWAISTLRSVHSPIYVAWLSARIEPRVRATVLSMSGQMDALGQIGGGPVLGLIGTLSGLQAALVAAGVALCPSLPLVLLARWHGRELDAPVATSEGAPAADVPHPR
jgi:MFS transporter, DHA3 family, tetracycline resistance protein